MPRRVSLPVATGHNEAPQASINACSPMHAFNHAQRTKAKSSRGHARPAKPRTAGRAQAHRTSHLERRLLQRVAYNLGRLPPGGAPTLRCQSDQRVACGHDAVRQGQQASSLLRGPTTCTAAAGRRHHILQQQVVGGERPCSQPASQVSQRQALSKLQGIVSRRADLWA
jgi:hypothetical protein